MIEHSFSIGRTDNGKYLVQVTSTDDTRPYDNVHRRESQTFCFDSLQEVFKLADQTFGPDLV